MVARDELQSHLAQMLDVERFRDYGPNGMQVEGRAEVHRLITGVTASLALIEAAVGAGAARFSEQDLGFAGPAAALDTTEALRAAVQRVCGRAPVLVPGDGRALRRIGWCTGGAQGTFEAAIASGVDAYITGEISEPQAHIARETGVAFVACGHHSAERFGAPALGEHVATHFALEHRFIDIENPA
jgi:putative NIF3 family GTP cyclohydrolase 1 type 2